jgi:putative FmdB family regulatory protein
MPIYDYECNLCQFRFEKRQRFDEEPIDTCPKCQGNLRRVIHSTPLLFKGSGFYITDKEATGREPDKKHHKGK